MADSRKISSNSMKVIHFSNPETILYFYKNQPNQGVIFDSSYSKMIALNKIENDYVIPVSRKNPKPPSQVQSSHCNTAIRYIDPNTATVDKAKENIKNDVVQTSPTAITNISKGVKRKSSTCKLTAKEKKSPKKRRNTIIGGDIFDV